ncbi:MAG: DUF2971 domain-containing protein [Ruminococcus sp.]|nr:DUF2971 domain-containing protein [Ruminococcus sp.]MCM1479922.1 DUF2971 domain-containing protein [Muribaculaceae bacterium]
MKNVDNYLAVSNGILKSLSDDDDCPIYHYTSVDGLKGIVENETLRFTNRFYLNDYTEGIYTFDLLISEFDNIFSDLALLLEKKDKIIKECQEYRNKLDLRSFKTFQASFSLDSDSLCLWNYYTKGNNSIRGYNINFNSKELCNSFKLNEEVEKILNRPFVFRKKVIYNKDEQISEIKEFINKLYEAILQDSNGESNIAAQIFFNRLNMIFDRISVLGIFFKDNHFKIENEYRIAIDLYTENGKFPAVDGLSIKFISKNDMFVPYVDIKFDLSTIKSITVSPTMNYENELKNLNMFLDTAGIKDISIEKSAIPVRF